MNSPSNRLLKIPPISIGSSASTPDLQHLERRYSLSRSSDDACPPMASSSSINLSTVTVSDHHFSSSINIPPRDSAMVSSSAPGSLQSSPRNKEKEFHPVPATPESVDRPRTLPPKKTEELQKHIKEYEEISKQIKKAMEKEAKEKQKKDVLKCSREKKLIEFRKVWVEEVLPQWEKNTQTQVQKSPPPLTRTISLNGFRKDTKKVQEMWRVGLPPSVRGQIWKLAIGNELMITKELFNISVCHAKQTKETMFGSPQTRYSQPDGANPVILITDEEIEGKENEKERKGEREKERKGDKGGRGGTYTPVQMDELLGKEGTVALVSMLDLPSDFPARELFVPDGPMHKQFLDVLEAYVAYRPDVGYDPCMSYLVAGFLLNMETLDSFISLANLIHKPFNLAFYITDRSQMYKYTLAADSIISTLLPKIHKRFKEINIEPESFLVDWFMTLFLKPLPLDIASRIWDIYFLEGEMFLFKVALALLKLYSHQFESYPRDLCVNMLNKFPKDINEDALFENIAIFNLDPKKFQKLLET